VGISEACPRIDNTHSGNFVNFACPAATQYHDLATIFFNTQVGEVQRALCQQQSRMLNAVWIDLDPVNCGRLMFCCMLSHVLGARDTVVLGAAFVKVSGPDTSQGT